MLKYITKNNVDILKRLVTGYGVADFYFYLIDNIDVTLYNDSFQPIHRMDKYAILRDLLSSNRLVSPFDFSNIVELSLSEFDVYDCDTLIKQVIKSDGYAKSSIPNQAANSYEHIIVSYNPHAHIEDRLKSNMAKDTSIQSNQDIKLDK